jgi:hypothetical protein
MTNHALGLSRFLGRTILTLGVLKLSFVLPRSILLKTRSYLFIPIILIGAPQPYLGDSLPIEYQYTCSYEPAISTQAFKLVS